MQKFNDQTTLFAHLRQLLLSNLPDKPYCGNGKCCDHIWPADYALNACSHVQFNHPNYKKWLVIDCDHQHLPYPNPLLWEQKSLPTPNFIVKNPDNGRFHVYYLIPGVSFGKNCSPKASAYYRAIYHALVDAWEGDESYTQVLSKNPLSNEFELIYYHDTAQSLHELHDYLPDRLPVSHRERLQGTDTLSPIGNIPGTRNDSLFNEVRFYAYKAKGLFKDFNSFYKHIKEATLKVAPICEDFVVKEATDTAKSIAKFTWYNYTGATGTLDLNHLEPEERMRAGASHTHKVRRKKTATRLLQSYKLLKKSDQPINRSSLAKAAGLTRQALYGPLRTLSDLLIAIGKGPTNSKTKLFLRDLNGKGVKFGVNQIIALWVDGDKQFCNLLDYLDSS